MRLYSRELRAILAGLRSFQREGSARVFGKVPNEMERSGAVVVSDQQGDLQR